MDDKQKLENIFGDEPTNFESNNTIIDDYDPEDDIVFDEYECVEIGYYIDEPPIIDDNSMQDYYI